MYSNRWVLFGLALVAAIGLGIWGTFGASYGQAMDPKTELTTAYTHAGFAAKYDSLNEVTLHLHHVVNCLVGPNGDKFDSSAGNPCQGQGNGALPDIKAKMGEDAAYVQVWWAATIAEQGIMTNNLAQAKAAGHIVQVVLKDMQSMK